MVFQRRDAPALLVGYALAAVAGSIAFFIALPRQRRTFGRRIVQIVTGSFLVGAAFAARRGNMQIEALKLSFGFDVGGGGAGCPIPPASGMRS